MTTKKYWQRAAEEREKEAYAEAEKYLKQMLQMYDAALDDIQDDINTIKNNYMKRFGIDEETADYFLSRELRKYPSDELLASLLTAGSDEERAAILDYIHADGLSTRAYAARTEWRKEVKSNIHLRMLQLEYGLRRTGETARRNAYKNNYYRVIDDTAREINAGISFSIIDDAAVREVMDKPWHGKRFSKRIWDNTERLAEEAQEIVGRYLVTGRDLASAANELAEAFEVEKFHAATLVRTETAHARAMSDKKAYEDIGAEEYRYMATLDERTCDICGPLDGQIFKMSELREGVNFPVMHPRCRCTTTIAMQFSKRRARDPQTGRNNIIPDMTYDQWRNSMTPDEKQAFEVAQRSYRNKVADQEQLKRYREVLGSKNVPKSLDAFQKLKYNDNERWNFVQLDYRRRNELINHPEKMLPNAKTATADDRKFTGYLFNPENKRGFAKGIAFTSRLGYSLDNYAELKEEILSKADKYSAKYKDTDQYGDKYEQKMILYGSKNRQDQKISPANVIVGWKVKDDKTWLTSAYIKEI